MCIESASEKYECGLKFPGNSVPDRSFHMRSSWRCIQVWTPGHEQIANCYPLDSQGRLVTKFKRQPRRCLAQLRAELQEDLKENSEIIPFVTISESPAASEKDKKFYSIDCPEIETISAQPDPIFFCSVEYLLCK